MARIDLTAKVRFNKFPKILLNIPGAVNFGLHVAAKDIRDDWRNTMINSPASGNIYFNPHTGMEHQASAPGEPPAVWSGAYINNIFIVQETPTRVVILTNVPHAPVLEFGGEGIEPRPVAGPVATRARATLGDKVSQNFQRRLI